MRYERLIHRKEKKTGKSKGTPRGFDTFIMTKVLVIEISFTLFKS